MPDQFNPDLLLTVGADISALRQQLATISRELNIQPVQVKLEAQGSQQATQTLNNTKRAIDDVEASATKLLNQMRAVYVAQQKLSEFRHILDPAAMQTDVAGATKLREALENIARTTQAVIGGTQQSAEVMAQFGADMALVSQKTREFLLGLQGITKAEGDLATATNASAAALQRSVAEEARADAANARRINQVTLLTRKLYELNEAQNRAGVAPSDANLALTNALSRLQTPGALPLSRTEFAEINQALSAANMKLAEATGATKQLGDATRILTKEESERARAAEANAARANADNLRRETQLRGQITLLRQLVDLEAQATRLGNASLAGRIGDFRATVASRVGVLSDTENKPIDPAIIAQSSTALQQYRREVKDASAATGVLSEFFDGLGTRMLKTGLVIGGLTLAFGTLRAASAAFREFIELDNIFAKIAATMDLSKNRAAVLAESMELLRKAGSTLGADFSDSGKVLLELEKSLNNNSTLVRAAFIPALVLAQNAAGNEGNAVKLLVGIHKLYGEQLAQTGDAVAQFQTVAGLLLSTEAASIRDTNDFVVALGNVAAAGSVAKVELKDTLAYLVLLTNGLQSASRAGTELRSLFSLIQARAPKIIDAFDLKGFDVTQGEIPVNRILDALLKKIDALGTNTTEVQQKMAAAFGGGGGGGRGGGPIAALQVLVAEYEKVKEAQDALADPQARYARALEESTNRVSAALGRLKNEALVGVLDIFDRLFNVAPGRATGLTKAIDEVRDALRGFNDASATTIIQFQKLKIFFQGGGTPIDFGLEIGKELSGRDITLGGRLGGLTPQQRLDMLQLDLQHPANQRQEALERQGYFLPQSQAGRQRGQEESFYYKEALDRLRDLKQLQEDEAKSADKRLSYEERIAAALRVEGFRLNELKAAEQAFRDLRFSNNRDTIEQQRGNVTTAGGAYNTALKTRKSIEQEQITEQAKSVAGITKDQEEAQKAAQALLKSIDQESEKIGKLALSNALSRSFLDADYSAQNFDATVSRIRESMAQELAPEIDRLREKQGKLWEAPNISKEEYTKRFEEINRLIAQLQEEQARKVGDAVRKAILSPAEAALREMRDRFATGTAVGFSDAELQKVTDQAAGVLAVTDAIRSQTAVLGLWGSEAAVASAIAAKGFESFQQLAEAAFAGGDKSLLAFIESLKKLKTAVDSKIIADIKTQIDEQTKALDAARGAYGQVGAEAIKYQLALSLEKTTYEKLNPEQKLQIDNLAQIAEKLRIVAAASGLVKLGFSKDDAESIALAAGRAGETEGQVQAGIEALRRLNQEQKNLRDLQEQATQEMAQASGDFSTFFISALRQSGNAAGDFFDNLRTLAQDTARSMQTSFSDFFFDSFQQKLDAGKNAWQGFLNSMERAIADFMSKQLVKSLLNILTGGTSGSGGNGGVIMNLAAGAATGNGFGNIAENFTSAGGGTSGIAAALFGIPATPAVVGTTSDRLRDLGVTPPTQEAKPATTGIIGSGGAISKDLQTAGAIAAAYSASQAVLKLTDSLSTSRQRNEGIGQISGTAVGGILGALFGQSALGAGAGGLLGGYLGGLFGDNTPAQGRFDEINRTIGTVQTALEAQVKASTSFTDLFNTLVGFQGGGALAAATQQPVSISIAGQSINNLSQQQFLDLLRSNPSSLTAGVQAGVNPSLLGPLNQEVVQTILAKAAALDDINRQISQVIADISAASIAPASAAGLNNLESLKDQALNFRSIVDQIVAGQESQIASMEALLQGTTDPALILQYTTQIKSLIEDRYQNETKLVQQFAGQLDDLATSLKNVGKSIDDQIFQLQLSNFGPTNPLQGLQLAQEKFNAAKAAFQANPTAENAQAIQNLVDPLLKSASDVFTRPSPEYRAIFDDVIATLENVKGSVDQQATDIQDALRAALGDSVSIQDLTQKNTASMAADMKSLLAIVQAQAAAAGIQIGATGGLLTGSNFPFPTQISPYQNPTQTSNGSQAGSVAAAGATLATLGGAVGPIITVADKLGLTDWLKNTLGGLFTSSSPTTGIGGNISAPLPTADLGALGLPDFSSIDISGLTITLPDAGSLYYTGNLDTNFNDIYAFQSGGRVPGVGSGDIVPAMLEPGEFVIPKRIAGPMRSFLEHLIGGRREIPVGPNGLHFADGGTVPLTAQDIQALYILQALLNSNNNQNLTQQQIAANTQLTAAILARLAQQSGAPVPVSSPTTFIASTPNTVQVATTSSSPSGGGGGGGSTDDGSALAALLGLIKNGLGTGGQLINALGGGGPIVNSLLGIAGGGLTLSQGIATGNVIPQVGGSIQLLGALSRLGSSALVSSGLGTVGSSLGTLSSTLGLVGSAAGVLGGGLGLYTGIQGMIENGPSAPGIIQTLLAAYQVYSAAAPLLSAAGIQVPTLTSFASSILEGTSVGAALGLTGATIGATGVAAGAALAPAALAGGTAAELAALGATAAEIGAAGGAAGTAGATGAVAATTLSGALAGVAGFIALPAIVLAIKGIVDIIEAGQDAEDVYADLRKYNNIRYSMPEFVRNLEARTALLPTVGQDTPAQALELLQLLQQQKHDWTELGIYNYLEGKFQVGDTDVKPPQELLDYLNPLFAKENLLHLRAQDILVRAGYTPDSIPGYLDPVGGALIFGPAALSNLLRPSIPSADFVSSRLVLDSTGGGTYTPYSAAELGLIDTPYGPLNPQVYQQILATGGTEQGLANLFPTYGGVQSQFSSLGFLAPNQPAIAPATNPALYDAAQAQVAAARQTQADSLTQSILGTPNVSHDASALEGLTLEELQALALQAATAYEAFTSGGGGMAAGGWVSGGTPGRDSVLRMLEPREFVVPADIAMRNADVLEGLVRGGDYRPGSDVSSAARSGLYRGAGGVSQVALTIAPGAISVNGAKDPKATAREVLDAVETNIRTGRLGQVIADRVRRRP